MSDDTDTKAAALRWVELLDHLEEDIKDAEALAIGKASRTSSAWQPPIDMPAIPECLVGRIREVLGMQSALVDHLSALRRGARQQINFVSTSAIKVLGEGPRFIDHRS